MALGATVHVFDIRLADADRHVYETLALRVARHPSESAEYLLTRVLAYCLEYTEGLAFSSGGLSNPDEPALAVRDLTGALQAWIEIGMPEPARLHKAAKAASRVVVYPHRDPVAWFEKLRGERIHRGDVLQIVEIDRDFLAALAGRLDRRLDLDLSISDRYLYLSLGGETLSGALRQSSIAEH